MKALDPMTSMAARLNIHHWHTNDSPLCHRAGLGGNGRPNTWDLRLGLAQLPQLLDLKIFLGLIVAMVEP